MQTNVLCQRLELFAEMFICHERGTKKKSESRTGIEPMASQIPVGALTSELGRDAL